jgi:ferrous iron transport protein B
MKIALLGNPNTGKSTIFNSLTGLRQHIGNFPGVTVDKKEGVCMVNQQAHTIVDFPGTYSVYPRSEDEKVVYQVLSDSAHEDFPDVALVVVDASNLNRNLFLFSQVYDLKIPVILVLNMSDIADRRGIRFSIEDLRLEFPGIKIVETTARVGIGIAKLKKEIETFVIPDKRASFLPNFKLFQVEDLENQCLDAKKRHLKITETIKKISSNNEDSFETKSNKLDKILVHPVFGYLIFSLVLFLLFQFIYVFASFPMDFIDGSFSSLSNYLHTIFPEGLFSDLISQGIVPGLGGVLVFVPQIALLFLFLSLLEESGYLARVVFIMDRLMRPLGLNGKSVVPLLSSVACAIPGIMATRTISIWKERLITILVAPLMSCSARIPVYTLLIALVIPSKLIFGFINLQGLVLFALYALGLVSALIMAAVMTFFIQSKEKSFLLLELPSYKLPRARNIALMLFEKTKVFVWEAGKVILAISVLLWFLTAFGPGDRMEKSVHILKQESSFRHLSKEEQEEGIAAKRLSNSYIGMIGKGIEPVLKPLGFDWKIGISLLTSFAAREVFVGSLATIYSVHNEGSETVSLIDRLAQEKRDDGTKLFTLATGVSLMVFYVYAMQCMATLAVVKRETKSWKWPLFQLFFMGIFAYVGAWITFAFFK